MQKKTLESPQMLRINIKHNFLSPFCHLIYWEDSFSFLAYMQLVLYQEWHTTEWCFPLCAVAASAFLVLQNRDCGDFNSLLFYSILKSIMDTDAQALFSLDIEMASSPISGVWLSQIALSLGILFIFPLFWGFFPLKRWKKFPVDLIFVHLEVW